MTGAFGKDQQLTGFRHQHARIGDQLAQGLGVGLAVHPDHLGLQAQPAEQRHAAQLLLHHVQHVVRHEVGRHHVEHALVLAGEDVGALGQAFDAANVQPHPGDVAHAENHHPRPELQRLANARARHEQQRQIEGHQQEGAAIEPDGVKGAAQFDHAGAPDTASALEAARGLGPRCRTASRARMTRYLLYSSAMRRASC